MKRLVILSVGLAIISFLYYRMNYLPRNMSLGSVEISGMRKADLLPYLARVGQMPVAVKIHERQYRFTLDQLGIIFDLNDTYRRLATGSGAVPPTLIFTDDFYRKVRNMKFDFSVHENRVIVNARNKELAYEYREDVYVIDAMDLQVRILKHFGRRGAIAPKVHRVIEDYLKMKVDEYNRKLRVVKGKEVRLLVNGTEEVVVSPKYVEQVLMVDYDDQTEQVKVDVDRVRLGAVIDSLLSGYVNKDLGVDKDRLAENFVSLIDSRFKGQPSDYLIVSLKEKPNSSGTEHDKFIEIDLSQQKMYRFEKGRLIAVHGVSTGLYYPTPPGKYKILNKATNAFSDIYNVWMPYWMAFSLDPKVNAYLGIHELPYWIDYSGREIRRPRDFIGSPHTGGCVSLDVGEAEVVYAWADVGTPVLIYE